MSQNIQTHTEHQDPEPGETLLYVYSPGNRHCKLIFAANPGNQEEIQREVLIEFQFGYGAKMGESSTKDPIEIFDDEYRVEVEGEDAGLTLTEFELFRMLYRHENKAFTRTQLLESVWEDAMITTERTVDAHVKNLKRKLGDYGDCIVTVRGIGYRYTER